jgi:hypothetical protein
VSTGAPPAQSARLQLQHPRSVAEILSVSLRLLFRYPLLVLFLAFIVVAPFDLLVLLVAHASPLGQERGGTSTVLLLTLLAFALVGPVVAALQAQALVALGEGERPTLRRVLGRSLPVLPVVVAAEIIAGIASGLGMLLFIIPGVILLLRWTVVAQVAALERTDWPGALRRSAQLSKHNYGRIFGLRFVVALVGLTLSNLATTAAGTSHHPGQVALGIAVDTLTGAFQALVLAVLYFDLRAREETRPPQPT